jgi:arylsulfatase A-like enzyme
VREPQVRVPLILRPPEPAPHGSRVTWPVSGVDVAPTLLRLAGLEPPAQMEGVDLLAARAAGERERCVYERERCVHERERCVHERERFVDDRDHLSPADHRFALYHGRFKLVRFGGGSDVRHELYDLVADPSGFTDVQEQHPEVFAALVARLAARTSLAGEPLDPGDSASSASALQALGYAGDE